MEGQGTPSVAHFDYVQLSDFSQEVRTPATSVLDTVTVLELSTEALGQGVMQQQLQALLAKELSCSRYFRWSVLDNLVEKILQGLLINQQDISAEAVDFCPGMIRPPSGGSLLLYQASGLKKMYAARGLVLTTEIILTKAIKISIAAFLSYRLYASLQMDDSSNFELTAIVEDNSKKGLKSLAYLLAKVPSEWLYLLLASPIITGVLKGLWDTRKSELLTKHDIAQLHEAVNLHTNVLLTKSYFWSDVLRQMILIPGFSSVSERVQRADQQIRWDGRITNTQRVSLFANIERLALQGKGMSKINSMQSLAKIAHSVSIKDFHRLRNAGYSQETLVQILRIKTQALCDLKTLSSRTDQGQANTQKSLVSTVYANYLLWWLGMGNLKHSPVFWVLKLGKLAFEGLFLKAIVESILEAIQCPDKQGFSIGSGEYPVWANQLTLDCFNEFIRQFRFIYKDEPFQPFLEQLNNFDLRTAESINLGNKALTSNETREILNVFHNQNTSIKVLNFTHNQINRTLDFLFPNSLEFLDLAYNNIGIEGARELRLSAPLRSLDLSYNYHMGMEGVKSLRFPSTLQSLGLSGDNIGAGVRELQFPSILQFLRLDNNHISNEGAKGLRLPPKLQSLSLQDNNISDEGAKGLELPLSLNTLSLSQNNIADEGAQGLRLPSMLTSLDLWNNSLGARGAESLQLPSILQYLNLGRNNIGDEGAKGLQLPSMLKILYLNFNNMSLDGIRELKLPPSLQLLNLGGSNLGVEGSKELRLPAALEFLDFYGNNIGDEGIKNLRFPPMLKYLNLGLNNLGPEGVKWLQFPLSLTVLFLNRNNISDEGIKGLQLPSRLESLSLYSNDIGPEGVKGLQFPASLQSLDLGGNNIGDEGAKELQLPSLLQSLDLDLNNISDEGAKVLRLPLLLQSVDLSRNSIDNEGVNTLLQKILGTSLTVIDLSHNPYNSTIINPDLPIQQQILLRSCQDKLCHANTPLRSQHDGYQTSSAARAQPPLFLSWLKKPFDKLHEYASNCMSATLDTLRDRLEKVLSQSPSYFPNIHSSDTNDWQFSSSVTLNQFKAGETNTLLLPVPQTALRPYLGSIAR